jgi:hypothetical protein
MLVVGIVFFCASACSRWKVIAAENSPDGKKEIVVWELRSLPDSIVSVTLNTPDGEETVFDRDPEERAVQRVHALWTKDSRFVVVRVFCSEEDLIVGYDTQLRRRMDQRAIGEELKNEEAIAALLQVPEG